MKTIKIEKFILLAFLSLILSIQIVKSLGVTSPMPVGLRLLRGDTARFYFEIQATTSSDKLTCKYNANGLDPLVVTFDENETILDAGTYKGIYGTVTVPVDAPIQTYNGGLTLSCAPYNEVKGFSGSIIYNNVNTRFPVSVVLEKEERAAPNPPVPVIEKPKSSPILLVLIIIILVLAIIGFYLSRKKKIQ